MNIQELAEQAGMTRRPADRQCRAPYWDVVIDPEIEHFADLVLEEAAKVCDKRYMGDNNREDLEARRCAAAIRALKGAKE